MGCASSKGVESAVAVDVYRPPPTSVAVFDINTIEEPWLISTNTNTNTEDNEEQEKTTPVPLPILEKLDSSEFAPQSWSDVSKALEDLKPALEKGPVKAASFPPTAAKEAPPAPPAAIPQPHQKIKSFHTLQELDAQIPSPSKKKPEPSPALPVQARSPPHPPPPELSGVRPVRDNSFILRDRQERESKKGDAATAKWKRRDPFEGYPDRRPPGKAEGVVIYTTTLHGVRRTFEDCEQARLVVEEHAANAGLEVDERDVSLHGEYLREVRELVGDGAAVPRLFISRKYIGGAEEVVKLGNTGRLREMFRWVARRGGAADGGKGGRRDCEGCSGARFVPCLECNGSCKVLGEDGEAAVRCGECNENGLVLCPTCH